MLKNFYAIFDKKAAYYFPPFLSRNDGEALRFAQDATNDPQSVISRNPGDFALVIVGSFDDVTGIIETDDPRHGTVIAECASMVVQSPSQAEQGLLEDSPH